MKVSYKKVKKMKVIRNFSRPNSVFASWKEDTKEICDRAFEIDSQFLKTFKFIKDKDDLAETHNVLREYFIPLKT